MANEETIYAKDSEVKREVASLMKADGPADSDISDERRVGRVKEMAPLQEISQNTPPKVPKRGHRHGIWMQAADMAR